MIRNAWYTVGFSQELATGQLVRREVVGRPLVVWRAGSGEVVALDGRCAHKRFPLWEGRLLDSDRLECAYHGFCYDTSGRCVAIPALEGSGKPIPPAARQVKYPVDERDGVVWVWTGGPERPADHDPPSTAEIGSGDWETSFTEPMPVAASYRLLIENLFDLTHFYPLHSGNIGSVADTQVPLEIERELTGPAPVLRTYRRRKDFVLPPMTRDRFGLEVADQVQLHEMIAPSLFRVVISVAPPGRLGTEEEQGFVLHQTITPVAEDRHVWRRAISCRKGSRNASDPTKSLLESIAAGAPTVVEQDHWALERQQEMFAFADDGYHEVHISTDRAVVMARKILDDMERAEEGTSTARRTRRAATPPARRDAPGVLR